MNQVALKNNTTPSEWFNNHEKVDLVKSMFCKGCSDEEFLMFMHACQRSKLDPFMKQIYAVKRPSKDGTGSLTIQVGIDGYRLIAERTGRYAPGKEPTFTYDDKGRLISATSYVMKMTDDGKWHEVAATAFYSEYVQTYKDGKPTQFWMKMAHSQTAKCAEALALRKAFPGDLSGLYTKEEMEQAEKLEVIETVEIKKEPEVNQGIENKPEEPKISKIQLVSLIELLQDDEEHLERILNHKKIDKLADLPLKSFKGVYKSCFDRYNQRQRENSFEQMEIAQ